MSKASARKPRYYDIERFRRVYLETLKQRKGFWRIIGRVTHAFDSVQGFFVAMLVPLIIFGSIIGVSVGASYGLFGFLAIFGGIIGGLAFVVDRRVGKSLQFGDYGFVRKTLAQVLAFLVMGGIIFIIASLRFGWI